MKQNHGSTRSHLERLVHAHRRTDGVAMEAKDAANLRRVASSVPRGASNQQNKKRKKKEAVNKL